MQNTEKDTKPNRFLVLLLSAIVIIYGLFIMAIPICKTVSLSGLDPQRFHFLLILYIALFLPSMLYGIGALRTRNGEYVIIPAVFLLIAEYYFFHDYATWIASDANAAIGLVIIPVYLMLILGLSYGIAFIFLKIRKR